MPALTMGAAPGFYAAAAQILPIFLLVMMIGEGRLGSAGKPGGPSLGSSLLIYVFYAVIIIGGEVAALIAVADGETRMLHVLTCIAIAASCAFLMMRFLLTTLRVHREHYSRKAQERQLRLVSPVCLLVLVATLVSLDLGTR